MSSVQDSSESPVITASDVDVKPGFKVNTTSYKIDPSHSLIEFSVTNLAIFHVVGHFDLIDSSRTPARSSIDGLIVIDENDWLRSSVAVTFESATVNTGDLARDEELRSPHFLDCQTYPSISFKSEAVEAIADCRFRVSGQLTLKGVTHLVHLDTFFEGKGPGQNGAERVSFSASTTIDRRDFGISYNPVADAVSRVVGNDIEIVLQLECVRFGRTRQTEEELEAISAVKKAESELEEASRKEDFETLRVLIADDLVYFGGNGASQTREEWMDSLKARRSASAQLTADRVRQRAEAQGRPTVLLMTGLRVGEETEAEHEYHGNIVISNRVYTIQDSVPGQPLQPGPERCLRHVRAWRLENGNWRLFSHRYIHALD